MGYTTKLQGKFAFDRELTHREWKELYELGDSYSYEVYKKYTDTPETIPDSYLQWIPDDDGYYYIWNGGEKFYDYIHWLRWVIKHYMKPHNLVLNGKVYWQGEEVKDAGVILVEENKVTSNKLSVMELVCPNCRHEFGVTSE